MLTGLVVGLLALMTMVFVRMLMPTWTAVLVPFEEVGIAIARMFTRAVAGRLLTLILLVFMLAASNRP